MVYHPNEFETAVTLGRSTVILMYQTLSQRVWRVRDYSKTWICLKAPGSLKPCSTLGVTYHIKVSILKYTKEYYFTRNPDNTQRMREGAVPLPSSLWSRVGLRETTLPPTLTLTPTPFETNSLLFCKLKQESFWPCLLIRCFQICRIDALEYVTVVVIQGESIWLQNLTYPGKVVIEMWISIYMLFNMSGASLL